MINWVVLFTAVGLICFFCKEGYAEDSGENSSENSSGDSGEDSGEDCNSKDKCPPKCQNPNEVWYPACNAPQCETTCSTWGQACVGSPQAGCLCGNGYARHISGKCIETERCRGGACTGAFEYFLHDLPPGRCTLICTLEGKLDCVQDYYPPANKCFCIPGYLRAVNGNCMDIESCKPIC